MSERYFEDYRPGAVFAAGAIGVDEADIIDFARNYDPQAMHTDPAAAARGPFGGLIASGWHTAALMMRLFAEHFLSPASSIASPGLDELRWLKPVRPGDTLTGWVFCADKAPSRSRPTMGVIHEQWEVTNQKGELVMTTRGINMVRRRPS